VRDESSDRATDLIRVEHNEKEVRKDAANATGGQGRK